MAVVCPTVTALTLAEYAEQLNKISGFSKRIQIDLMDQDFAKSSSEIKLDDVWWPRSLEIDIHLMYQHPNRQLKKLLHLGPDMVIIHAEADVHHMQFAAELHKEGIKTGLAVLPKTNIESVEDILNSFDHLLIFSGHLGHFGGQASLDLARKAKQAKENHPDLEVGWDGGVGEENAKKLSELGVDVLNVGGAIQRAEDPKQKYEEIVKKLSS